MDFGDFRLSYKLGKKSRGSSQKVIFFNVHSVVEVCFIGCFTTNVDWKGTVSVTVLRWHLRVKMFITYQLWNRQPRLTSLFQPVGFSFFLLLPPSLSLFRSVSHCVSVSVFTSLLGLFKYSILFVCKTKPVLFKKTFTSTNSCKSLVLQMLLVRTTQVDKRNVISLWTPTH